MSQTPGKTQAVHFYLVNEKFYLVDLPGYGYAKVAREVKRTWGELVQGYLDQASALRLIFLLLDARRIPTGEDLQMFEWTRAAGLEERIVLTKSDKLSNNELAKNRRAIAKELQVLEPVMITCSAVTKQGIDELRRQIASRL